LPRTRSNSQLLSITRSLQFLCRQLKRRQRPLTQPIVPGKSYPFLYRVPFSISIYISHLCKPPENSLFIYRAARNLQCIALPFSFSRFIIKNLEPPQTSPTTNLEPSETSLSQFRPARNLRCIALRFSLFLSLTRNF
jgi:hypothetical protein